MSFVKATKKQSKLRLSLIGPSGSGKTYSALAIASHLGSKLAVIDTERGSASKYAGEFSFDKLELSNFHPQKYIDGIKEAQDAGYDVLVIDSLSHAWMGKDGALELVDKAAKRQQSQNTYTAWKEVTPLQNALVDAILQSNMHVIVTMRAKTEYVMETNERGKSVPRKIGMAPVQRDGMEYEFDVVADMDLDNNMIVSKSRCKDLNGLVVPKPGKNVADTLLNWLTDGAPVEAPDADPAPESPASSPKPPQTTTEPAIKPALPALPSATINEAQRKRLFAIAKQNGYTDEEIKTVLIHGYEIESSKAILVKDYDAIVETFSHPKEVA